MACSVPYNIICARAQVFIEIPSGSINNRISAPFLVTGHKEAKIVRNVERGMSIERLIRFTLSHRVQAAVLNYAYKLNTRIY